MKDNKKIICLIIFLCVITIAILKITNNYNANVAIYKTGMELKPTIQEYNSNNIFYLYEKNFLKEYKTNVSFDKNGVLEWLIDSNEGIYVYNLKFIALYGLNMYSEYLLTNEESKLEIAKIQADALLNFQNKEDGIFYYDYETFVYTTNKNTTVPWGDSGTQGVVISFLSRMYNALENEKYKTACELALKPFSNKLTENGFVSNLYGNVFYDGYLVDFPTYNLSDFLNSLIGLYDMSNNLQNEQAKKLYDKGIQTLKQTIHYYNNKDNKSLYNLSFVTDSSLNELFVAKEHFEHIYQLELIKIIENIDDFDIYIENWRKGYK